MPRLYTRTGDDGTTGLFGGQRVSKDHLRIIACGEVDETNACLGLALAAIGEDGPAATPDGKPLLARIREMLTELQSRLFDLGADLATPIDGPHESKIVRLTADHVAQAEHWIDEIDSGNAPMTHFVLPGGTELAARLHLARTVCRRAERRVIALARTEPVNTHVIVLLNRLSDLLFALARRANREAGLSDIIWQPQQRL